MKVEISAEEFKQELLAFQNTYCGMEFIARLKEKITLLETKRNKIFSLHSVAQYEAFKEDFVVLQKTILALQEILNEFFPTIKFVSDK